MNEYNLALLREIVETKKLVCRICIEHYGEDHELTKESLKSLGKMVCLLCEVEEKFKAKN